MTGLFIPEITAEMFRNGCLESIEALMTEGKIYDIEYSPWIPVSERLPESNRLVLCYITTGISETYFLALWNDIQNDWEEGVGGYRLLKKDLEYEVIAWMPLPQPYKAENEDNECKGCYYNDGEVHAECVICDKAESEDEE